MDTQENTLMSTTVSQSVVINQPVENVFAFFADTNNITKWQTSIIESRATPEGPAQPGTKVTDVRTFLGRKMESTYEFTDVEPNKRIALRSISGPFPYQGTMNFESEGGTATRVTFDAEIEPKGFFKLAEGMLAGTMKKETETQLATAKQLLESQA